jgi:hypothetical protein
LSDTVAAETRVSPIQIFSDPTEPPVIAARRLMPAVWAVAELSSEALMWCTRVRNDGSDVALVSFRSGWNSSWLFIRVGRFLLFRADSIKAPGQRGVERVEAQDSDGTGMIVGMAAMYSKGERMRPTRCGT